MSIPNVGFATVNERSYKNILADILNAPYSEMGKNNSCIKTNFSVKQQIDLSIKKKSENPLI